MNRIPVAAALLSLGFLPSTARSCPLGPPLPVHCELVSIHASPAEVWAVVEDFAHPELWQSAVAVAALDGSRLLLSPDGSLLKERLDDADPVRRELWTNFPEASSRRLAGTELFETHVRILPDSDGGSRVLLTATYQLASSPENALRPDADRKAEGAGAVAGYYLGNLSRLKALTEGRAAPADPPSTAVDCFGAEVQAFDARAAEQDRPDSAPAETAP